MFNISYEATLVAGQIGFSLHEESTPVVEPFAGWAMLTTQDTHLAVRNHIQASLSSLIFVIIHLNIHKVKDITHHSSIALQTMRKFSTSIIVLMRIPSSILHAARTFELQFIRHKSAGLGHFEK